MRTEYDDKAQKLALVGPGIWMDEPDEAEWDSLEWRVPCLVLRSELGSLCGYVGVGPSHPWHGVHLHKLNRLDALSGHRISWAAPRDHLRVSRTDPTVADHWYIGFHTAHAFDLQPVFRVLFATLAEQQPILTASQHGTPVFVDTYKDFVWVRGRVEELAEQARKAGHS